MWSTKKARASVTTRGGALRCTVARRLQEMTARRWKRRPPTSEVASNLGALGVADEGRSVAGRAVGVPRVRLTYSRESGNFGPGPAFRGVALLSANPESSR